MSIQITSETFAEGAIIPEKYSCDGENLSPSLVWTHIPSDTKSIALIVDDPDAPSGVFVHWVLYNINPSTGGLPEGVVQKDSSIGMGVQGKNSYGKIGYMGPCPPKGSKHRYFFRIFALDIILKLEAGASRAELDRAMAGHILDQGQLMGFFSH